MQMLCSNVVQFICHIVNMLSLTIHTQLFSLSSTVISFSWSSMGYNNSNGMHIILLVLGSLSTFCICTGIAIVDRVCFSLLLLHCFPLRVSFSISFLLVFDTRNPLHCTLFLSSSAYFIVMDFHTTFMTSCLVIYCAGCYISTVKCRLFVFSKRCANVHTIDWQ